MKIEMVYLITEHSDRVNLNLHDLAPGPLDIIWFNNGNVRSISGKKVAMAIDVLKDMTKHKGPDTGNPLISFFWDDAAYLN